MLMSRALRLGQTFEVVALEIAQLGSCHLGKYPWEVASWEISVGKHYSNIHPDICIQGENSWVHPGTR